jgi:small subunit ribosomal protein S6
VKELERQLRINEEIIRTLTVRVEAHEEGPSAMLKSSRDDSFGEEGGESDVRAEA